MQTLYDAAGGEPAMLALSRAMNARCVADAELSHAFAVQQHADHDERLAAYWGEVLGGPPAYTERFGGTQSAMVRMHAGDHEPPAWHDRFLACFLLALDDAGLPDDVALRSALRDYMAWAVKDTGRYPDSVDDVPEGLRVPRWSWNGLVT